MLIHTEEVTAMMSAGLTLDHDLVAESVTDTAGTETEIGTGKGIVTEIVPAITTAVIVAAAATAAAAVAVEKETTTETDTGVYVMCDAVKYLGIYI